MLSAHRAGSPENFKFPTSYRLINDSVQLELYRETIDHIKLGLIICQCAPMANLGNLFFCMSIDHSWRDSVIDIIGNFFVYIKGIFQD